MRMHLTAIIPILMTAIAGHATVAGVDKQAFRASLPDRGTITYSEYQMSFSDWRNQEPVESEILNLFPDYKEANSVYIKNGERKEIFEKVTVYVAKIRTSLQTGNGSPNLKALLTEGNLARLDKEIKHKRIGPQDVMPRIAGSPNIAAFDWCANSAGTKVVMRPKKEISLGHVAGHDWCRPSDRSVCLESCYPFEGGLATVIKGINKVVDVQDPKDPAVASQSELTYYNSEAEYAPKASLASLTGINAPVTGVLEQNIFYFNQIFQYGKLLAVFQKNPKNPNLTVMTNFLVLGVRARSWDKTYFGFGISHVLKFGLPKYEVGMAAGIPSYSQIMTSEIAKVLEATP